VRDWGWGQPPLSFWDSDSDPKTLGHWKAEASEGMREAAGGSEAGRTALPPREPHFRAPGFQGGSAPGPQGALSPPRPAGG
jgi:hypothetical protein